MAFVEQISTASLAGELRVRLHAQVRYEPELDKRLAELEKTSEPEGERVLAIRRYTESLKGKK